MKYATILIFGLLLVAGCEGNFLTNAAPSGPGTFGNDITESGETCAPVTECFSGDGCCVPGCSTEEDEDCNFVCGDGEIEAEESAAACNATCTLTGTISECVAGDGCCPTGCDATTDDDCTAKCGNGVVEANETCDGDCPAACDDGNACTVDAMQGSAATCNAVCAVQSTITACVNADGCCPAGCTPENDSDCQFDCTDIDAWPSNWAAWEDDVITEVNIRRSTSQTCGIYGSFAAAGPVTMSPKMRIAARCHSQDMGDRNRLGHAGSNGSSFSQRIGEAGYNGQAQGENVAAGQSSPSAVVTSWMNSQGHCRNIMNGDINRMGIGYFYIQQSTYRHWWTMVTGIGGTN